jgi:hypothetical protein
MRNQDDERKNLREQSMKIGDLKQRSVGQLFMWFFVVFKGVLVWPNVVSAQACPQGFLDPRNGGECWECPAGFNRTIFAVTASNACEAVLPATFSPAARQGRADCAAGDVTDPRNGGECWRCPAGLVRTWSPVNGPEACGQPGGVFDRKRPATFIKSVGCNQGEFPDLGSCWTCPAGAVRDVAHIESNRACVVPSRTEVRHAALLGRVACGRLDEKACAIVGRNSCDPGLVEFDNACRTRGDCGTLGKRRCLAGEPGAWEPLTGCATALVPTNNVCTRPACGRRDELACTLVGRSSCDPGLVEFDSVCRTRGDCGAAGQRACLVGESSLVGCRPGLSEQGGQCHVCGALGQRACAIVGRTSCDDGLVEVNDMCFKRGQCGAADQRACLLGERAKAGCNAGLSERAGRCEACGALGQPACAIVGRRSCRSGLVEANNTCFARGACGAAEERACLIGERPTPGCDAGLSERNGMCWAPSPLSTQAVPRYFVFVRLDPPLAFLFGGRPVVSLVASVHEWHTKKPVVASTIELFRANYTGPGSVQPLPVATCTNLQSCSTVIASGSTARWPATVSYKARVSVGATTVETPVRLADLRFVGAPMRLDVSAETLSSGKIRQVPLTRTVDIVFYAGTGYELSTPGGARVFSVRLLNEQREMLRADADKPGASSLAENWAATSFHVSLSAATVKAGGWRLGGLFEFNQCEHSTPNPVPWGDAQGILHPGSDCRDWSVPGPFYSAGRPAISWHEMHHAAFGLSDEYCAGTVHHQHPRFPNVYTSQAECVRLGSNAATCARIAEPVGCSGAACNCSTDFWRSDSESKDAMVGNGEVEGADDLRAVRGKFLECRAGRC